MTTDYIEALERRLSSATFRRLRRGLGWLSTGLSVVEIVAPRALASWLDLRMRPFLRFYGARELSAGLGILAGRKPAPWLWGRVGGDMMDLATLGAGLLTSRRKDRVMLALGIVAGITFLDVLCAEGHSKRGLDSRS